MSNKNALICRYVNGEWVEEDRIKTIVAFPTIICTAFVFSIAYQNIHFEIRSKKITLDLFSP